MVKSRRYVTDKCRDAVCTGHGRVSCHADVCDNCRVKFYNEMSEEIAGCPGNIFVFT